MPTSATLPRGAGASAPSTARTPCAPSIPASQFVGERRAGDDRETHAACGLAHEIGRRAGGDDAAVIDEHDAIAEPLRFLHVVRAVENGRAGRGLFAHGGEDALARLRIDADRRLVEQEHARCMQEGAGEIEAPLHAAGEGRDDVVGALGETGDVERARDGRTRVAPRQPEQAHEEMQVLACGQRRVERDLLRHQAERAPRLRRLAVDGMAGDRRRARARPAQRREHGQRRGFAGAVRPQQADDLAGLDREADAVERRARTVAQAQILDGDGGGGVHGLHRCHVCRVLRMTGLNAHRGDAAGRREDRCSSCAPPR